jgi:hypothetical protein
MQDSRGGLKLKDLKGSGGSLKFGQHSKIRSQHYKKPRGQFVKHHIFFYLQHLVTPTDREHRPSVSQAVWAARCSDELEKGEETQGTKQASSPAAEETGRMAGDGRARVAAGPHGDTGALEVLLRREASHEVR